MLAGVQRRSRSLGRSSVADWSADGQLLVAARVGWLQIRNLKDDDQTIVCEADLSKLEPNPTPVPAWAQSW